MKPIAPVDRISVMYDYDGDDCNAHAQELQASCAREADLQRSLSEKQASSQLHLEQLRREHSSTISAERRSSSELQATLQRERALGTELRETLAQKVAQNQQMLAEITDLRKQLQSAGDHLRESEHQSQILQETVEKLQEEAARANQVVEQSEQRLREKQLEIERLDARLRSQQVDSKAQMDHSGGLLESEKRATAALRNAVQAKETELTRTMDQFLQEKVATARAHGELNAMRGRLNRAQTELEALQKQVDVEYARCVSAEHQVSPDVLIPCLAKTFPYLASFPDHMGTSL